VYALNTEVVRQFATNQGPRPRIGSIFLKHSPACLCGSACRRTSQRLGERSEGAVTGTCHRRKEQPQRHASGQRCGSARRLLWGPLISRAEALLRLRRDNGARRTLGTAPRHSCPRRQTLTLRPSEAELRKGTFGSCYLAQRLCLFSLV
jgi:hypothetical protein